MRARAVLLGLLMSGLCLGSQGAFGQELRRAILSEIKGPVEVRLEDGSWKPAENGMVLYEQGEIRSGEGGFAEILLDEGGSTGKLELQEKSHLRLSTLNWDEASGKKETYLDLAIGKVLVHAEKLQGDSKFEVRTPNATAGVRGTVFEVSVDEEE